MGQEGLVTENMALDQDSQSLQARLVANLGQPAIKIGSLSFALPHCHASDPSHASDHQVPSPSRRPPSRGLGATARAGTAAAMVRRIRLGRSRRIGAVRKAQAAVAVAVAAAARAARPRPSLSSVHRKAGPAGRTPGIDNR
jgi:hypothetical protein